MASYAEAFKNGPKFDQSDDSISSVKPVFIEESDVFGDIPKPHLKGKIQLLIVWGIGSDTDTEIRPWLLFPIPKPGFGCTLVGATAKPPKSDDKYVQLPRASFVKK